MSRRLVVVLCGILILAGVLHWSTRWLERSEPPPSVASGLAGHDPDPAERFRERLRVETGRDPSPVEVFGLGRRIGDAVEARMDTLAAEIRSGARDWRPVFDALAAEHPATEEEVLALYRSELASAESFVREHRLTPLPGDPLRVEAVESPILRRVFPLALYVDPGRLGVVLRPPRADGPAPEYLANHCTICVPPLAVHEGYPGHHVAYGLAREAAGRPSDPSPSGNRANMTYQEGWAQYAELLMLESGYWEGSPARELGALRLVLLRALRAEVDGALAAGEITSEEAEDRFVERIRMTPTAARAEVAGHLEDPGRKSSYLLGALQILSLREALGLAAEAPGLFEFHGELLKRPAPVPVLAEGSFGVVLDERFAPELVGLAPQSGEDP